MSDVHAETIEQTLTKSVREADQLFQNVGGGTRHWVRECLLPMLEKHGLVVVRLEKVKTTDIDRINQAFDAGYEKALSDNFGATDGE